MILQKVWWVMMRVIHALCIGLVLDHIQSNASYSKYNKSDNNETYYNNEHIVN